MLHLRDGLVQGGEELIIVAHQVGLADGRHRLQLGKALWPLSHAHALAADADSARGDQDDPDAVLHHGGQRLDERSERGERQHACVPA